MGALPKYLDHNRGPDPLCVFELRAQAKAKLVEYGQLTICDAVDALYEAALKSGLIAQYGDDFIQSVLSRAFVDVSCGAFDA